MNKKSVTLFFAIAVIAAVIFWARLGTQNKMPSEKTPMANSQGAASVASQVSASQAALPARKNPTEYNAMMSELSKDLSSWKDLHPDDQRLAVAAIMQLLDQQGSGKIANSPAYYAERINQASVESPEILEMPIDRVLIIFAVMDYDFETGQDKEELARDVLGPAMYAANKARRQQLGLS